MPDRNKLTETTFRRIVECVRKGGTYAMAARRACVTPRTLRLWMAKGRKGEGEEFVSLISAISEAENERAEKYLDSINTQAETDGKLALEMLARLYPKEYGSDTQRMKHIERRLAEIEKKTGGGNG